MLLPALLDKRLIHYRQAHSPQELFDALTKKPHDLLVFFLAACEDSTWCESHAKLMQAMLAWLTMEQLNGGQPAPFFQAAAKGIRASHTHLKELLPLNFRFLIDEAEFPTNTLLVATSGSYFSDLIHRQCRIGKKESLRLDEENLSPYTFAFILEFIHTGSVELLWREEPEQIMLLHTHADRFGLNLLQDICVAIFKRYLTAENVIAILLTAHNRGWKMLRQECIDYVNSNDMGIAFADSSIGQLFFAFLDCNHKTRDYFFQAAHSITHLVCHGEMASHPFMQEAIEKALFLRGVDVSGSPTYPELLDTLSLQTSYLNLSECQWLDNTVLKQLTLLFPQIEEIVLRRSGGVTTSGWSALAGWKRLRLVDLTNCFHIKDDELNLILQSCPAIEELSLHNCQGLTDKGIKNLSKQHGELLSLNLGRTALTDEALIEIAFRCNTLQQLDISHCEKITEKGVREAVKHAKNLRKLVLKKCSVPLAAIAQLQQRFPRIEFLL